MTSYSGNYKGRLDNTATPQLSSRREPRTEDLDTSRKAPVINLGRVRGEGSPSMVEVMLGFTTTGAGAEKAVKVAVMWHLPKKSPSSGDIGNMPSTVIATLVFLEPLGIEIKGSRRPFFHRPVNVKGPATIGSGWTSCEPMMGSLWPTRGRVRERANAVRAILYKLFLWGPMSMCVHKAGVSIATCLQKVLTTAAKCKQWGREIVKTFERISGGSLLTGTREKDLFLAPAKLIHGIERRSRTGGVILWIQVTAHMNLRSFIIIDELRTISEFFERRVAKYPNSHHAQMKKLMGSDSGVGFTHYASALET
ncbi:hypothetical protein BDV93DRAFT_510584 [Ceratobasidium sp. AG-I]|nr:hypothetical protein BDV93DRAFT_510584 [Ceratobasidium sp. AG-I]